MLTNTAKGREVHRVGVPALVSLAGSPWVLAVVLLLVAALGSFVGDNIAFLIGRSVEPSRLLLLRGRRVSALGERARSSLEKRPGAVIPTARFVPVGRVVVNVLAGASGFSRRCFLGLTAVSGLAWAAYSVLLVSPITALAAGGSQRQHSVRFSR